LRTLLFVIVGLIGVHSLIAQAPTRQRGEQVLVAASDQAGPTATGVVIGIPGDRVRFSRDAGVLVNGEAVAGVPADVLTLLPPVAVERTVPEGQYFIASRLRERLDGRATREYAHFGLIAADRVSSAQPSRTNSSPAVR
jgi:hypothetical protein